MASGFLLGAVLCSMLLGHYYLTAPAMTIDPLKRTIALIAWGLAARAMLAGIGLAISVAGLSAQVTRRSEPDAAVLYFGRWGMGFLAAGIATYMTWKTARFARRNRQPASSTSR